MTDQHPLEKARITRDRDETGDYLIIHDASPNYPAKPDSSLVGRVAQWGYEQVNEAELRQARDEELEACCGWLVLNGYGEAASRLRAARRPKPPSLKEQALALLDPSNTYGSITQKEEYRISVTNADILRRALEALPDD